MKKLVMAVAMVAFGVFAASAETYWSTWNDDNVNGKDIKGCILGLSSNVDKMSGAQIDVCISKAETFRCGAQFAFGYSRVATLRNGVQLGFWNEADHAALQFGLICHNRGGFLPWFPFFNFDKTMFGSAK